MINKKIAYLSIILLALLLVYMSVHLFILSNTLDIVQGSEGLRSAKIGFMGYEIINKDGSHHTSFTSPSVIMMLILLVYFALLIKFRGNKLLIFNLSLIVLSILFYQVFLSGFNDNLELATTHDNFSFWNVNLIGYEFMTVETRDETGRIVDSSLEKGINLSLIPLVLSILGNIMYLRRGIP
ncbi:MAG: hypothetical protein KAJ93_00485 [Methanosarcinales archaeon]|nr:hypothetical protein [Methanosarcinales archaeon]